MVGFYGGNSGLALAGDMVSGCVDEECCCWHLWCVGFVTLWMVQLGLGSIKVVFHSMRMRSFLNFHGTVDNLVRPCGEGGRQSGPFPYRREFGRITLSAWTLSNGLFWLLSLQWFPRFGTGHFGVECQRVGMGVKASVRTACHEMLRLLQCILCVSLFDFGSDSCHGINGVAQQHSLGRDEGWTLTGVTTKQAPGGCLSSRFCKVVPRWLFWFFFVSLLRVGEASHPGPRESFQWTLGLANPSGLNGKLDLVNHMPGDAWILTETHLSQRGTSMFVKGLRMLRSRWTYAVAGAPCPPRAHTDTGTHSGVLALSRFPTRALPHSFDADAYATGRIQVVGMAVADTWVTIGMVYGIPCNASHKLAKFQTDAMLSELIDRVGCQTTGPRVIGKDFNYGPEELEQLHRLRALGFREVQDLRAWRFGISTEPTRRGAKRIDQVWISPELQQAFLGVSVEFDHWPDHAAVVTTFCSDALSEVIATWPQPLQFPWPTDWTCQVDFDAQADLTIEYAKFWGQMEAHARFWVKHQGKSVLKRHCGRASVLEPRHTREVLSPVKKGRKGDIQPSFMGISLQHAQYVKQLRRLQSLVRILDKTSLTWNGQLNRDETWKAIRHAAGFPGGFWLWWVTNGLPSGSVSHLPLLCPSVEFVRDLFLAFQDFVQKYERDLARQRYQFATQRRADNMAYVFQDCRDDPPPTADCLLDRVEVGIEEVRHEDRSIVLVRPVVLLPDVPVVANGKVLDVVAHHDDQLWAESVEGLQPGHYLTQERAVSSDAAILERFGDVWKGRWLKMSHVLPGQWNQICDFLERTANPIEWTFEPWSVSRFQAAVRHKKKRAARGPDGVSQPDLAALPVTACTALTQLYDAVEAGANWPLQMACGFVSSLAKTPQPQGVDEFRSVVVYSLPYMVWSSERAKEAMHSLAVHLPTSVQGGVPARQAKTIWFELAMALETSYLNGEGMHGLLMDIQKCFNNIPRYPLWFALAKLDFPQHVLRAWVSFVSGQVRRFRVRRSVGDPIQSTCGLPEGCALSVFGMAIVDWMLDWWLKGLEVTVDLRTFVDDWGVMFHDSAAFHRIWSSLEQFTGQMDLAIDMKKTRVWSTQSEARKSFRQGAVKVALAARNLGAHQNFSRHCHNAVLLARLSKMPPIWVRLRASHGPYKAKLTAIHMMAWPTALHGVTVVHLGECQFKPLRAGAMKALKANRKGANPYLHLASSAFQTDPEAWAILQTVRDVRELGSADHLEPLLGLFAGSPERLPSNGPTAILVSRLRRLGWAVGGQGLVQDRFGTFSLFGVGWDELTLRLKLAWGSVLAEELSHRPTFNGLSNVDLPELHRSLKKYSPADLIYLRCHLDGTLFTQNAKAKFKPGVSSKCPWCSDQDGFHHRAWICPFFASCRTHLTPAQRAALSCLPPCYVDHGWPIILPEWEVFAGHLLRDDGLCKMSPVCPPCNGPFPLLELFTDGTAAFPEEAKLRFAAWAVTVVAGCGFLDNHILMGGHVHGLCQTAFRAELTAIIHAVTWAVQRRQCIRIWCDCQSVVRGLLRLLHKQPLRKNVPHSDLWWQLRGVLAGFEGLIQVRKVVSHCLVQQASDPVEQWAYWHNNLTDKAAEAVNLRRSQEFWQAWGGLHSALHFHRQLHCAIQRVLPQTSKLAVASQAGEEAPRPN